MQRIAKPIRWLLTAALLVAAASQVRAAETPDFGVIDNEPQLAAWLDLAPLVSTARVDMLRDGVDLAIDFRLTLKRPRRLWGSETIVEKRGLITIGYHIVTEDFVLKTGSRDYQKTGRFATLAGLHRCLSDSIMVDLVEYRQLDSLSRYRLRLDLTCISLTGYNLAPSGDTTNGDESAVKYLFRHFLKLTGFGRDSFSADTEPFSPADVRHR